MSHKSTEAYVAAFKFIEENVFPLEAESFMTDYESNMRKAIRQVYPNALLNGCWFHFCQAVRRKARSFRIKLMEQINKSEEAMQTYLKLLCLPLLPSNKIMEGYKILVAEAMANKCFTLIEPLFAYFKNFWLKPVSSFFNLIDFIFKSFFLLPYTYFLYLYLRRK